MIEHAAELVASPPPSLSLSSVCRSSETKLLGESIWITFGDALCKRATSRAVHPCMESSIVAASGLCDALCIALRMVYGQSGLCVSIGPRVDGSCRFVLMLKDTAV